MRQLALAYHTPTKPWDTLDTPATRLTVMRRGASILPPLLYAIRPKADNPFDQPFGRAEIVSALSRWITDATEYGQRVSIRQRKRSGQRAVVLAVRYVDGRPMYVAAAEAELSSRDAHELVTSTLRLLRTNTAVWCQSGTERRLRNHPALYRALLGTHPPAVGAKAAIAVKPASVPQPFSLGYHPVATAGR